jgi:hypothetical protein
MDFIQRERDRVILRGMRLDRVRLHRLGVLDSGKRQLAVENRGDEKGGDYSSAAHGKLRQIPSPD